MELQIRMWLLPLVTLFVCSALACTGPSPNPSPAPADAEYQVSLVTATWDGLPGCTSSNESRIAFVSASAELCVCTSKQWRRIACTPAQEGEVAYSAASKTLWACVDRHWTQVELPAGPKGDTGATGPAGPQGDTGAQGPQGLPGVDGMNGADGADGMNGADGKDGANGADGAQGPAGSAGPAGPAGPAGSSLPPAPLPLGSVSDRLVCMTISIGSHLIRGPSIARGHEGQFELTKFGMSLVGGDIPTWTLSVQTNGALQGFPELNQAVASGALATVELDFFRFETDVKPYLAIKLGKVTIANDDSVALAENEGVSSTTLLRFQFNTIQTEFSDIDNAGRLGAAHRETWDNQLQTGSGEVAGDVVFEVGTPQVSAPNPISVSSFENAQAGAGDVGQTTVTSFMRTAGGFVFRAMQSVLLRRVNATTVVALNGSEVELARYTFEQVHYESMSISGGVASLSFGASSAIWKVNADTTSYAPPPPSTDAGALPSTDASPGDSPDPDAGASDPDAGSDVDGGVMANPNSQG